MTREFDKLIDVQKQAPLYIERYQNAQQNLDPLLEAGVLFSVKNQPFRVRFLNTSDQEQIQQIVTIANRIPQLCGIDDATVANLADKRLALIVEGQARANWEVASYLAAEDIDVEEMHSRVRQKDLGLGIREMRSSFTATQALSGTEWGGYGLNAILKVLQIGNIFARSEGLIPVGFTDVIPGFIHLEAIKSQAMKINQRIGLQNILVSDLGPTLRQVLVSGCPPERCVIRGDALEGHPACQCQLWYFNPEVGLPRTKIEPIDAVLEQKGVVNG